MRAANCCSNPDCGAITSGPADDPSSSVNVGEAAHIYGMNPGSARYDVRMSSSERSDIANAIWLCSNCHKLIDDDPNKYPAGLLFEWQRDHERRIAIQIGKASADIRGRYEGRHLEEFGRLSYRAERLLIERADHWEYRLTAEVLRFEMAPILQRWRALKRYLYMKPSERVPKIESISWMQDRMAEILHITRAFDELTNIEFRRAWGEPGVPGNDAEIIATCRLYREMCASALSWEERVRFVSVDDTFAEVRSLFIGIAGGFIDEAAKVPAFLSEILADGPESGEYRLDLMLTVPDGWVDAVHSALGRVSDALMADPQY